MAVAPVRNTYEAVYRLAARPFALSNAFGAAGRKQYATIHHPASSLFEVKLRHVFVAIESASAAAIVNVELVRITTVPATGNPAITASRMDSSAPAADAVLLALPTTGGTEEAQPLNSVEYNLGITGAASTANPPVPLTYVDLVETLTGNQEADLPTIRPGTLEGWAVTFDAGAAATVNAQVIIEFTEKRA